jgi:hypothetical protein
MVAASELPINRNASDIQMAREIFGDGIQILSADYDGDRNSSGIYSNGDAVAPGVTPGNTGVILSTGRIQNFTNGNGQANQDTDTSTNTGGDNDDPDFNAAAGTRTYDAAFLEVDFIPDGDVMTMQFVFSSEEYPEFVNSVFQDFVGVWINGDFVEMSVGNGDADPGNLNATSNQNLFIDNSNSDYNTEMDGFTVTMSLKIPVNAGVRNTIKIGIADVSDSNYDSNLLIAGGSIQTALVAEDDAVTIYPSGSATLDVTDNDNFTGTLTITHLNGVPVVAGSTVTLNTGQTVELNADGTITVVGDGDVENINFTYTVSDGTNSDTAFVQVDAIPCFVAGTLIETETGPRAVETLVPGDLIVTHDNGLQPMRWIGTRTVEATGDFAPVLIRAGTFGDHGDLFVSPQHRVLVRDTIAELLFGESEVLVAAKHLLNDRSIRRVPGGDVTYVHILFDRHEIVYSQGLPTESLLPGQESCHTFNEDALREIGALFPELDVRTGAGYSPAARMTLRRYEAAMLPLGQPGHRAA